jgi:hypothetical protein
MTVPRKLPPGFTWRRELDQDTLYYDNVPVARVEPLVQGTVVRSLVRGPQLSPCETLVPNVERGIALATRWAAERQGGIHQACRHAHETAAHGELPAEAPSIARWFQT